METNVIWRNARAAVIELDDGGYFTCADTWEIFVNDEPVGTTNTVETYVDGLVPGKRNLVRFVCVGLTGAVHRGRRHDAEEASGKR